MTTGTKVSTRYGNGVVKQTFKDGGVKVMLDKIDNPLYRDGIIVNEDEVEVQGWDKVLIGVFVGLVLLFSLSVIVLILPHVVI